ncbi:MAG: hypothetical protein ACRDQZ_07550, partial [Mycobacteriales bacterium]
MRFTSALGERWDSYEHPGGQAPGSPGVGARHAGGLPRRLPLRLVRIQVLGASVLLQALHPVARNQPLR